MSVAPVCQDGGPLQLTCTASVESGIRWKIFNQVNEQIINDVLITIGSANNQRTPVTVDHVMFTFMRTSAQGASPLVSTLSIDSVSVDLNGTVVRCADLSDPSISVMTIIQIIDTSQSEFIKKSNICILYSCSESYHRFPSVHPNIEGFDRAL